MRLKYTASLLLSSVLVLGLGACSSNSDSEDSGMSSVLTGYFLDARVKGLQYTSAPSGRTGVTNAQGEFEYEAGDTITFKLGNGTPISIGTVTAKPVVQVTELPNFLDVARTLQTLDTDQDADTIDVGQITMPAAVNTALASLLNNGQGDIDTILSDANIQAIEDASQPAAGSTDPTVDLINTSAVSTGDAIEHISENISEDYTTEDLARQVYKRLGDNGNAEFMYINADGSGKDYWRDPTTGTESESFSWSINADKDAVVTYQNGSVTASLISVEGNKYIVSALDSDSSNPDITELLKAKPLSIADLDGKVLRRVSPDSQCAAQTFKVTGSSVDVKESCGGQFHQFTAMLSESSDFDNTLILSGTSPNGNAFSVIFSLMEGELVDGSVMKWAALDKTDAANIHFEEIEYELADEELQAPAGFTSADISRQVYVVPEDKLVLAFKSDGTGTEFIEEGNGNSTDSDFDWSIDSQNRLHIDYGIDTTTVTLNSVSGDTYAVTVSESNNPSNPFTANLKRALPLTLTALNSKIISLDVSGDSNCTDSTLKFTGTDAREAEVCSNHTGGQRVRQKTVAEHPDFDNAISVTSPDGDVAQYILSDGDLVSGGNLTGVYFSDTGSLQGVRVSDAFTVVTQEAVPQ